MFPAARTVRSLRQFSFGQPISQSFIQEMTSVTRKLASSVDIYENESACRKATFMLLLFHS
jgi:hypothetical protein